MPVAPNKDFLLSKAGPIPVWGWGALGLVGAYAYSKYKSNQSASQGNGTTATTNAAGESTASAPEFIIENNEPWGLSSTSSSATVNITPSPPVPVTTPPGTNPQPPTNQPPLQGGNPPRGGGPFPVTPPAKPPTKPPTKTPPKPAAPKYTVYKVQHGDNLSTIAAKYHTTWQALWSFNTGSNSPRDASAKATLLKRGPNLLYAGEEIYIPQ